jgi:hypothetical protein
VCYAFIVWLVFVPGGIHEEVWTFEQVDFVGVGVLKLRDRRGEFGVSGRIFFWRGLIIKYCCL